MSRGSKLVSLVAEIIRRTLKVATECLLYLTLCCTTPPRGIIRVRALDTCCWLATFCVNRYSSSERMIMSFPFESHYTIHGHAT